MDTLLIARYDLIRRIRNRSALFTAFIGPLSLAVVFSLLVAGAETTTWTIGLVDLDGTDVSAEIVAAMTEPDDAPATESDEAGTVTFRELRDRQAAVDDVDDGDVDAAIVVPDGYAAAVEAGRPIPLEVLRDPDRLIAAEVARSVAGAIGQRVEQVSLAATVTLSQQPAIDVEAVIAAAGAAPRPITAVDVSMGEGEVSVGAYFGASMAVLFLFFTIGLAAQSMVAERRTGTLSRILATPARLPSVVAGKTIAVGVLGFAGFVSTWLVTTFVFGAEWGSPTAVLALMLVTVMAVGGVSMFVTSLARTEQQAQTYTATVAFVLALLGGNFLGPGAAPPLLQRLSLLTPNGWALDAFSAVAIDGAAIVDVATEIAVLGAFGLGFGAVGIALLIARSSL